MENIGAFNQYAVAILDSLYDAFPIPTALPIDDHVGTKPIDPPPPLDFAFDMFGRALKGLRVGPRTRSPSTPYFWEGTTDEDRLKWQSSGCSIAASQFEAAAGRDLDESERSTLLLDGVRPLLPHEEHVYNTWLEATKKNRAQKVDISNQEQVYRATARFLVREGFARATDLRHARSNKLPEEPADHTYESSFASIRFVLSAGGFDKLNRPIFSGPLDRGALIARIKSWGTSKLGDATASAAASAIVGALLGS